MRKPPPPVRCAILVPISAGILFALAAASATSQEAASVKVYTLRSIPVSATADATVIYLDEVSAIEDDLSAGLPDDPARAVTVARQRLLDGGASLQRKLHAAYQPIAEAWSLGITTLPAVVIDGRYVVYGESDVASAVARIEAFRRANP